MSEEGSILLQNDFERPATKFLIQGLTGSARLIQAAAFLDSIVAYWTHAADFCNTIGSEPDIELRHLNVAEVPEERHASEWLLTNPGAPAKPLPHGNGRASVGR